MSFAATTVSAAVTATQTTITVASTTNITNPNFQTGAGITLIRIDQEFMLVTTVNTTTLIVNVVRGFNGTSSVAHVNGALVLSGIPSDFAGAPNEIFQSAVTTQQTEGNLIWPAVNLSGSTDAIPVTSGGFYVVKTAGVDAMTIATPTVSMEGFMFYISSDTANAHTLTAASACFSNGTAATTVVTFKAFKGSNILFRVCNLTYHVISSNVTSFA